ncbi:CRISPR-associated endonuclease Cas3'' [Streptomyces sp. TLI_053]|uniref:CRISPR-associated endonuclease Cas3'' n=1 Tax=Streptomyces sp. TLI_053 TaxID=1855352 RepID=UPI001E42EE89|nr:CRISPR-associated endonuclease Cas3'' [Streptomyces sp. TLI_053]
MGERVPVGSGASDVVAEGRFGGLSLQPWGKSDSADGVFYGLLFHLLDTAAITLELWDRFLTRRQRELIADGLGVDGAAARSLTAFFASLHDIGKLTPWWQHSVPAGWMRLGEELREDAGRLVHVPHDRASMHLLAGLLEELGYDVSGNDAPGVRVAQIAGGHHGRFLQVDLSGAAAGARVRAALGGSLWQELRRRYVAQLRHLTGAGQVPGRVSVEAAVVICGLGTVADRLASRRAVWLGRAHAPAYGAREHFAWSRGTAREVVADSGLGRVAVPGLPFEVAHGLEEPNALQASVMARLPLLAGSGRAGILVVTDATGTGKSVTALEATRVLNEACGTSGVCWLTPTTALADAAFDTVRKWVRAHRLEGTEVGLVHSHGWHSAAFTDRRIAAVEGVVTDDADTDGARDDHPGGIGAEAGHGRQGQAPAGAAERRSAGWEQGLLAQFTVATVDQALMAVQPVRHNALRLLALSGRTVVVDEAHALEPFSELQLRRLLAWLGGLGSPVVLLSATLPASRCDALVRAYLAGTGLSRRALEQFVYTPAYPGWLFADSATGVPHRMDEEPRRRHIREHTRTVRFEECRVPLWGRARTSDGPAAPTHLDAAASLLAPFAEHGGCAAVVRASTADAQATYLHLKDAWPHAAGDVVLLHARLPADRRQEVTARVRAALGPAGPRPRRMIVVATSVLELGLNLDLDEMVADLAALARLLQLAGRLRRFELAWRGTGDRRAAWLRGLVARLTVLVPTNADGKTSIPPHWRPLEPAFLLHETAALLQDLGQEDIEIPGRVQELLEAVHGAPSTFHRATWDLEQRLAGYMAAVGAQEHLSARQLVPPPARVSSLADLHRQHLTAAQAVTRPGVLPRRLLPCHHRPGSRSLTLDAAGEHPLPVTGRPTAAQVRAILQRTLPAPRAWIPHVPVSNAAPPAWRDHPLLADIVLLPGEGFHRFGDSRMRIDPELGLVRERD